MIGTGRREASVRRFSVVDGINKKGGFPMNNDELIKEARRFIERRIDELYGDPGTALACEVLYQVLDKLTPLKPCPFCGSEAREIINYIRCINPDCGATIKPDNVKKWNRRANEEEAQ